MAAFTSGICLALRYRTLKLPQNYSQTEIIIIDDRFRKPPGKEIFALPKTWQSLLGAYKYQISNI